MNPETRQKLLAFIDTAHTAVEVAYPTTPVYKDTPAYLEKRRLLLADLSLHLAQDALKGEAPQPEKVRQRLFAISTLYAELYPAHGFSAVAQALTEEVPQNISAG